MEIGELWNGGSCPSTGSRAKRKIKEFAVEWAMGMMESGIRVIEDLEYEIRKWDTEEAIRSLAINREE